MEKGKCKSTLVCINHSTRFARVELGHTGTSHALYHTCKIIRTSVLMLLLTGNGKRSSHFRITWELVSCDGGYHKHFGIFHTDALSLSHFIKYRDTGLRKPSDA